MNQPENVAVEDATEAGAEIAAPQPGPAYEDPIDLSKRDPQQLGRGVVKFGKEAVRISAAYALVRGLIDGSRSAPIFVVDSSSGKLEFDFQDLLRSQSTPEIQDKLRKSLFDPWNNYFIQKWVRALETVSQFARNTYLVFGGSEADLKLVLHSYVSMNFAELVATFDEMYPHYVEAWSKYEKEDLDGGGMSVRPLYLGDGNQGEQEYTTIAEILSVAGVTDTDVVANVAEKITNEHQVDNKQGFLLCVKVLAATSDLIRQMMVNSTQAGR